MAQLEELTMCPGSAGSRWDDEADRCVAGSQGSFCDSVSKTTCYVGRFQEMPDYNYTLSELIDAGNLLTAAIKWDLQPGILPSLVEYVGTEWESNGLRVGDRIVSIGNNLVTRELLSDLYMVTCDIDVMVARGGVVCNITLCGS